jgi:hypothetical protein
MRTYFGFGKLLPALILAFAIEELHPLNGMLACVLPTRAMPVVGRHMDISIHRHTDKAAVIIVWIVRAYIDHDVPRVRHNAIWFGFHGHKLPPTGT